MIAFCELRIPDAVHYQGDLVAKAVRMHMRLDQEALPQQCQQSGHRDHRTPKVVSIPSIGLGKR
jgi:hypothetical protein